MAETRMPLGVPRAMTQEEFRALPEGPPDFEFEYGVLIPMPRPHSRHQDIVAALVRVLPVYVARHGLGRSWVEIDVELNTELTYVPDLVFLAVGHLERYSEADGKIHGVPDLVVEVVSRHNPGRDRVTKFNNYLAVGVPWYWLIDAESLVVEEYHAEAGHYVRTSAAEVGQAFRPAAFPGLELDVQALLVEQGAMS
jgi:Uma2 family endonuclease